MTRNITPHSLLAAVGGIGDDIICEASDGAVSNIGAIERKKKRRVYTGIVSGAAACFVLVAAVGMVTRQASNADGNAAGPDINNAVVGIEDPCYDVNGSYTKNQYGVGSRLILADGKLQLSYVGYRPGGVVLKLEIFTSSIDMTQLSFYAGSESAGRSEEAVVSNHGCAASLKLTVNGQPSVMLPCAPGTYNIDIDYSELGSADTIDGGIQFEVSFGDGYCARVNLINHNSISSIVIDDDTVVETPGSYTADEFIDVVIVPDSRY